MQGFFGCYWRFDLGRGEGERIPIEASVLRKTLGGVGLGSWLLHRECPVGIDPFDPRAPLVFSFSPLVGTGLTTSAKFAVVAKSPLSGRLCDALASSHFALAGKALGVDAIVLVGACAEPSELIGESLRPSAHWGRTAEETTRSLSRFGRVATIGPAGEARVRFATLSAEGRHAGRGGLGAVMGAKNLKALVVDGREETPVAEPARVAEIAESLRRRAAGKATAKYRELGTTGNLLTFDRLGVLPTRNFRQSHFDGAERLAGEAWKTQRPQGRSSCAHCTIGCAHRFAFGKDETTRIEYESLFALGPLVGVNDPDLVLAAARRCDELGLDTISAGATLAFAMECGERGLLEGAPRFGEGESLVGWLEDIAQRKGLGDLLAEGSRRLANRVGGGSIDFAPQVKGLEMPGYEPRSLQSMALGFAVGARGADHNRSSAYETDFSEQADRLRGDGRSVAGAVESEDRAALMDSLILCKFVRGVFTDFFAESAELLTAVTGFDYDASELRAAARRIVNLRKGFNIREGWTPAEDTLPERFLTEALDSGPASGARLPRARLAAMIEGYNRARDWDASGWIPDATWQIVTQGLEVADLESRSGQDSAGRIQKGRAG
jgi:aldehyde:ferredoxin oxidoreductase